MAKKKTESAEKTESKAPAAKKAVAAKPTPAKKAAAPAAPATSLPSINTNAAAAAAALIGNRVNLAGGAGAKPESAAFKAMKQNLAKPSAGGVGNLLGSVGGEKKSNLPFAGGKQVGKNQTFGADVNRTGVPRRTGG